MSFYQYKDFIEEGDLVLAFISRGAIKPITVKKDEQLNTRYGHFEHNRMIGMRYGEQMGGARGYGFIYLLHPTPELWSISLPHRTQIVYTPDSSYIMQRLNVTSGTRVLEAGTGSGSFTHAFARTVGLNGRVFSYEFHEPRYLEAKKEFEHHDLKNTIITHRDVCNHGFELESIPDHFSNDGSINGDVIFLDLPSPWAAIPHLKKVMSNANRVGICCFSPCIEQVDKTIKALQENGWINIEMTEVAGRRWEARKEQVRDIKDVVKRLKDIQSRKGQGIENRRNVKVQAGEKRDFSQVDNGEDNGDDNDNDNDVAEEQPKFENLGKGYNPFGKGIRIKEGDENYEWRNVTKIESEIKTHTSYLTFATFVPAKDI